MKPEKKKGRGVARAFLPPRAAADVTATDPLRRRHAEDADDRTIAESDSAMNANSWLIPGGKYLDAQRRKSDRGPRLSTMDEHGVEDLVNNMSQPPRNPMTDWNPSDPFSADNPEVSKKLRAEELARKRKIR